MGGQEEEATLLVVLLQEEVETKEAVDPMEEERETSSGVLGGDWGKCCACWSDCWL